MRRIVVNTARRRGRAADPLTFRGPDRRLVFRPIAERMNKENGPTPPDKAQHPTSILPTARQSHKTSDERRRHRSPEPAGKPNETLGPSPLLQRKPAPQRP